MKTVMKLKLKTAIIREDAKRIMEGKKPINNIHRLALEMERIKPRMYRADNLDKWLYNAYRKGIRMTERTYIMDEVVNDLCELLRCSRAELVNEEPSEGSIRD